MKNKNIVLLTTLISIGVFSCNTPTNNVQPTKPINSPTSTPLTSPTSVNPIPSISPASVITIPAKLHTVKLIVDKNILQDQYDYSFSDSSRGIGINLLIDDNQIYYSDGRNIYLYNLQSEQNKYKNTGYCHIDGYRNITDSSFNNFCGYSDYNFKKGKNNVNYLFGSGRIAKFDKNGDISEIFNANKSMNEQSYITDITVDKNSNLYFFKYSYLSNQTTLNKVNSYSKEEWSRAIDNTSGEFIYAPRPIEVDKLGNLYLFDSYDLKIKKMTPDGVVSTIIGGGSSTLTNILGTDYQILDTQIKLAIDNNDDLYLVEKSNSRVIKYDQKSLKISTFIRKGDNNLEDQLGLNSPLAMTFDVDNNAYIFDGGNKVIKKLDIKTGLMSVIVGNSPSHGDGNDLSKVFFKNIYSIYAKNNDLYVSELDRVRKIDSKGVTKTIAGNGQLPEIIPSSSPIITPSGLPADQSIVFTPQILYIDKKNSIYISERGWIRKIENNKLENINPKLSMSESITQDNEDNYYFSSGTIKKVDKNNNISIFAGQPSQYDLLPSPVTTIPNPPDPSSVYGNRGELKDGTNAKDIYNLNPSIIVSDSKNNIYTIAQYTYNLYDYQNNKYCIIKISPDGIIKNIAGNSNNQGYTEDELLNSSDPTIPIRPRKLIIDKQDNLYFIDSISQNSELIRKIDAITGKISVYAGKPSTLNNSENLVNNNDKARDIFLRAITDITIDDNGFLYFTVDDKIYRIE
ncbi:MAG: hypothetical protein H7263_18120 [Candidatus Sericytochromatia bacterium]|nr:hypothetical protein [Candidatus Sericytochromatia bacterium]